MPSFHSQLSEAHSARVGNRQPAPQKDGNEFGSRLAITDEDVLNEPDEPDVSELDVQLLSELAAQRLVGAEVDLTTEWSMKGFVGGASSQQSRAELRQPG